MTTTTATRTRRPPTRKAATKVTTTSPEVETEETQTEETAPTNPYAVDAPYGVDLSTHEDATVQRFWPEVKLRETELWGTYKRLKSVQPPSKNEIQEILDSADDPKIEEYRNQIVALREQLEKLEDEAYGYVQSGIVTVSDEELKQLQDTFRVQRTKLAEMVRTAELLGTTFKIDGLSDALKDYYIPTLRGTGPAKPKGTGTGAPRPRIQQVVISNGNITRTFPRLSGTAAFTKADVYGEWLKAAGKNEWQEVTDIVKFDVDGWTVEVTPEAK